MNINTSLPATPLRKGKRYLQQYQIDYIIDHGENLTAKQLCQAIGCSQPTIWAHCKKLKVTPTKSFFQMVMPVIPPCVDPKTITNE